MSDDTDLVRLAWPVIDDSEAKAVAEVLATGILTQGPRVVEFEHLVAEYVGASHAVAVTSATTALHLALVQLGIGPGDEVLVPDFTFPATANVVIQQGAMPVLVDIELSTLTVDPVDLARKITPRSKCILTVDTFGCPADYDAIRAIAQRHNLPVLADAACSLGASYKGTPCGQLGDMSCFSFHPRKIITTGEGGIVTTQSAACADQLRLLRSHGGLRTDGILTFVEAGFNYRLSDIQAAVGIAQMKKLNAIVLERRELATLLTAALAEIDGVRCPSDPPWGLHTFQSYVVMLDERLNQRRVIAMLRAAGIEATIGTYALHEQPFFAASYQLSPGDLPKSHYAYSHTLTLPLHPRMRHQIARIAHTLSAALTAANKGSS